MCNDITCTCHDFEICPHIGCYGCNREVPLKRTAIVVAFWPSGRVWAQVGGVFDRERNVVLTGQHRVTPGDQVGTGKEKLEQKVIDFEKLDEAGLQAGKWDVVFITYVRLDYAHFSFSH